MRIKIGEKKTFVDVLKFKKNWLYKQNLGNFLISSCEIVLEFYVFICHFTLLLHILEGAV